MHSPHSPLHTHSQKNQQNKLSARYINNKSVGETQKISSPNRKTVTPNSPKRSCTCTKNFCSSTNNNRTNSGTDVNTTYKETNVIMLSPNISNSISALSSLPPLASKLICSCEKEEMPKRQAMPPPPDSGSASCDQKRIYISSMNATIKSAVVSKRLVATRNAATSPHLDMRKLGSMTTVIATDSHAVSGIEDKSSASNAATTIATFSTSAAIPSKLALEKSNSLGESKPLKQLRTTRSLSPRPPVRHQQSIIVSDENEVVSVKLTLPSEKRSKPVQEFQKNCNIIISNDKRENGHVRRRKLLNNCRSEQTSPNTTDLFDPKFVYNQSNNRSTGCLVYVPTDPWMKMENYKSYTFQKSGDTKIREKFSSELWTHAKEIAVDPWVMRTDTLIPRSPKQERFRQVKSFSAIKFDVGGVDGGTNMKITETYPKLQRSKSPIFTGDNVILPGSLPLQSAPTSPHFLKTPENPFSSAFSLTYPYSIQLSSSPPRSASFSPARARINSVQNPFDSTDSPSVLPNLSPPSISVAASLAKEQQQRTNYSFLNVCNPNLLQARHSFSSVSNQQREDELQLNIRRLSEQMRQTNNFLSDTLKISSLTDRNDSGGTISSCQPEINTNNNMGADFSEYLEQFRCIEAKKAATAVSVVSTTADTFIAGSGTLAALAKHSRSKSSVNSQKSQSQPDSLLETTC